MYVNINSNSTNPHHHHTLACTKSSVCCIFVQDQSSLSTLAWGRRLCLLLSRFPPRLRLFEPFLSALLLLRLRRTTVTCVFTASLQYQADIYDVEVMQLSSMYTRSKSEGEPTFRAVLGDSTAAAPQIEIQIRRSWLATEDRPRASTTTVEQYQATQELLVGHLQILLLQRVGRGQGAQTRVAVSCCIYHSTRYDTRYGPNITTIFWSVGNALTRERRLPHRSSL